MLCAIWYHLINFKNVKNTHGGVLLLVKLQASKSNTPPWVFFMFFKLYKWYQIAQRTTLMIIKNNKPFIKIRNHGTQHAILKMIETQETKLNMGHKAGVIYMDLSKAFDNLNNELLIAKLKY